MISGAICYELDRMYQEVRISSLVFIVLSVRPSWQMPNIWYGLARPTFPHPVERFCVLLIAQWETPRVALGYLHPFLAVTRTGQLEDLHGLHSVLMLGSFCILLEVCSWMSEKQQEVMVHEQPSNWGAIVDETKTDNTWQQLQCCWKFVFSMFYLKQKGTQLT